MAGYGTDRPSYVAVLLWVCLQRHRAYGNACGCPVRAIYSVRLCYLGDLVSLACRVHGWLGRYLVYRSSQDCADM